jgi:ribosomal protein S18 acetylase RimI-like enzyme
MVEIRKATSADVDGIVKVCTDANWATYTGLWPPELIGQSIQQWYTPERITKEVMEFSPGWHGYYVAVQDDMIVGVAGGGMIDDGVGELYVIYVDAARKRQGIGRKLMNAVTAEQVAAGAKEQWLSVAKGNNPAIRFYETLGYIHAGQAPAATKAAADAGIMDLRYKRVI